MSNRKEMTYRALRMIMSFLDQNNPDRMRQLVEQGEVPPDNTLIEHRTHYGQHHIDPKQYELQKQIVIPLNSEAPDALRVHVELTVRTARERKERDGLS